MSSSSDLTVFVLKTQVWFLFDQQHFNMCIKNGDWRSLGGLGVFSVAVFSERPADIPSLDVVLFETFCCLLRGIDLVRKREAFNLLLFLGSKSSGMRCFKT